MMTVSHTELVNAPLDVVRAAVLAPQAYTSNTKVGTITVLAKDSAGMLARINGNLGPFRSSIVARYDVFDDRIDLTMVSGKLRGFFAQFLFRQTANGVELTHRESYDFGYGPLNHGLDRALRNWAHGTVVAEVQSLKTYAEAQLQPPTMGDVAGLSH